MTKKQLKKKNKKQPNQIHTSKAQILSGLCGMLSQTPVNLIVEFSLITDTKEVDKVIKDVRVTVLYAFVFMISFMDLTNRKHLLILFSLKKKTMCTAFLMSQTR